MRAWKKRLAEDELAKARIAPLSPKVSEKLRFVASLVPEEEDWLALKKRLMLELAPEDRQLFSTRDPETKKHFPFNQFERQVRQAWLCLTGKTLRMPPEKMADDADPAGYL